MDVRQEVARAAAAMRRGEWPQAESTLAAIPETAAGAMPGVLLGHAYSLEQQGRWSDAGALYQRATRAIEALQPAHPTDTRLVDVLIAARHGWARQLIREGNRAGAISVLEHASHSTSAQDPWLAELYFREAADRLQQPGASPDDIRRLLELGSRADASDSRFPHYLGLLNGVTGTADAAIPLLLEASRVSNGDRESAAHLLAFAVAAQDWPAAAAVLDTVPPVAPDDRVVPAALIRMLAGRRLEAVSILEDTVRRKPGDGRAMHALLLASFHAASAGPSDCRAAASELWERAIGCWAALEQRRGFWTNWQVRLEESYGVEQVGPDPTDFVGWASQRIGTRVEAAVSEAADAKRLGLLLQRERLAARLLSEHNGLLVRGERNARVSCGPLMIRFLGVERLLGSMIAELESGTIRIRSSFSVLGFAQAHLAAGELDDALKALRDLRCATCRSFDNDHDTASKCEVPRRVCRKGCPGFDADNPGYSALPDKHTVLATDAAIIESDIHVECARRDLAASDLDGARQHWREAMSLADGAARIEAIRAGIIDSAVGRVEVLDRPARRDEAVDVLEAASDICGVDPSLTGRLADVLTARGIECANADMPRWDAAVRDLRRAVLYNPYAPRPVLNLAIAVRSWAHERHDAGDHDEAFTLCREAVRMLENALGRFGRRTDLSDQLDAARAEVELLERVDRTSR